MPPSFVLSFKKNISVIEELSDRVVVQSPLVPLNLPQITLALNQPSSGLLAAIRMLAADGATEEYLTDLVLQTEGLSELPKFYYYLQKFINLGMICHTVLLNGLPLATRVPISPSKEFKFRDAAIDQKYVLSRFAYCRKDQDQLLLESPLSHAEVILADWKGAAIVAELARPQTVREIGAKIPSISEETIQQFFSLLLSTEILGEVREGGKVQEEENETLVQWEFHDLLFHSRTRTGRHRNPVGRTYPFLDKIEPLPVIKPKVSDETIDLYKPDIQNLKETDYPLTRILEERKSIRSFNDSEPITDKQLGEFLYRSARLKEIIKTDREEISSRPYANGGAVYELELYVIINICQNIPSGLYHYCPKEHQLCRISGRNSYVEALLEDALLANRQRCCPQVLIIIAARFPRISWNYESIAYATVLKNVGALYQTMYLVATTMNLAPCAIGEGNSDLFVAAVGTDYYAESSVGEFMLGSIKSPNTTFLASSQT
jgi:SagB-type dehydrogenase family enzyme